MDNETSENVWPEKLQENPFEKFTNGALKFDGNWRLLSEFWRFPRFQDLYKLKLQAS